jgi:hypothetical protein
MLRRHLYDYFVVTMGLGSRERHRFDVGWVGGADCRDAQQADEGNDHG